MKAILVAGFESCKDEIFEVLSKDYPKFQKHSFAKHDIEIAVNKRENIIIVDPFLYSEHTRKVNVNFLKERGFTVINYVVENPPALCNICESSFSNLQRLYEMRYCEPDYKKITTRTHESKSEKPITTQSSPVSEEVQASSERQPPTS